jgi:hypothetical protein
VSNDAANDALNRVQIVPLTSKTDRLYISEAYVTIDGKRSKAMAGIRAHPQRFPCSPTQLFATQSAVAETLHPLPATIPRNSRASRLPPMLVPREG